MNVANTKALISCEITAHLICAFVLAYAKIRFSHDAAYFTYEPIREMLVRPQ